VLDAAVFPVCIPLDRRVDALRAPGPDALSRLSLQDAARLLAMFAGVLTRRQLDVLILRYWHELPVDAICDRLAISRTSEHRAHVSALAALRKRMEEAGIRRTSDVILS